MTYQRQDILKKCEAKLKKLSQQYKNTLERPIDTETSGCEIIDMAFREQHLQHSNFFRERMRSLLPEIQEALMRIKRGTYGFCIFTGEEIEANRLVAVPWTQISITALQKEAS